jgi:hypothetical protein
MTPATPAAQPAIAAIGPAVVPLLAIAAFINYVDRGNLATAAPLIKDQLHLSITQVGLLLSAFFWSYMPALILAGWLAERINPYRTLGIGLALWSIATALSGVATEFATLIVLRLLLGLAASVLGQAWRCQWADWRWHGSWPRPGYVRRRSSDGSDRLAQRIHSLRSRLTPMARAMVRIDAQRLCAR